MKRLLEDEELCWISFLCSVFSQSSWAKSRASLQNTCGAIRQFVVWFVSGLHDFSFRFWTLDESLWCTGGIRVHVLLYAIFPGRGQESAAWSSEPGTLRSTDRGWERLKGQRFPLSCIRSAEFLHPVSISHFHLLTAFIAFLPDILYFCIWREGEAHKQRPPTLESSSFRLFHRRSCGAEVRRLWVTKAWYWYHWLAVEGYGCLANAIGPGLASCSAVFGFLVGSRRSSTKHSCSSAHHHSQTLILCLFFFSFSLSFSFS